MQSQWVQDCLQKPVYIAHDVTFKRRRVYYKVYQRSSSGHIQRYVKVVVELSLINSSDGKVITAYLVTSPKAGEKLEWPISSS
jgi:hypothetical protein